MNLPHLFSPTKLGALELANRIVMAPMTRNRAEPDGTPTDLMAEHYGARAQAGLIVAEGAWPEVDGQAYCRQPGIATPAHIQGWRRVTDAVHQRGGRIVLQIMHSGRIGSRHIKPAGARTVAPSAVAAGPWDLARLRAAQQLHPTPDRRDWRRWLAAMQLEEQVPLQSGQLFDMLELGIVAAARGYGVSIGDLLLVAEDVAAGRLGLPWPEAVASGDSYYLVWPRARRGQQRFSQLAAFLQAEVASLPLPAVGYRR